jgi:hypothetical protein
MKLTAEQKQLLAEIMAEMQAENEAKAKPKHQPRQGLGLPHTKTETNSYRMPLNFKPSIETVANETNMTHGLVVWHLTKFAFTGIRTPEFVKISESLAFKNSGDIMKD